MAADVSQILSHIASGVVGGLAVAVASHFLTKDRDRQRDRASAISADKRAFIPVIDPLITWAKKGEALGFIRYEAEQRLTQHAMRFRMHLKGERLIEFNKAWDVLMKTTRDEVDTRQPNDSDETHKKMQDIILSRLEAVRKIAHDT